MKTNVRLLKRCFGLLVLGCLCLPARIAFAQKTPAPAKIGTYDSRVVVFAYSRSQYFIARTGKMKRDGDSVMHTNDTAAKIASMTQIMTTQHLLHQQVFSTGTLGSIMNLVKDKLPQVAKQAGVSSIVSKWELNYADPSIETVDVTMAIANLFQPKEDISKMAADIEKQDPVPIEEMSLEEIIEMWKQFEAKYLGRK